MDGPMGAIYGAAPQLMGLSHLCPYRGNLWGQRDTYTPYGTPQLMGLPHNPIGMPIGEIYGAAPQLMGLRHNL